MNVRFFFFLRCLFFSLNIKEEQYLYLQPAIQAFQTVLSYFGGCLRTLYKFPELWLRKSDINREQAASPGSRVNRSVDNLEGRVALGDSDTRERFLSPPVYRSHIGTLAHNNPENKREEKLDDRKGITRWFNVDDGKKNS